MLINSFIQVWEIVTLGPEKTFSKALLNRSIFPYIMVLFTHFCSCFLFYEDILFHSLWLKENIYYVKEKKQPFLSLLVALILLTLHHTSTLHGWFALIVLTVHHTFTLHHWYAYITTHLHLTSLICIYFAYITPHLYLTSLVAFSSFTQYLHPNWYTCMPLCTLDFM